MAHKNLIGITAIAHRDIIGNKDELPWGRDMPSDMKFFREKTSGHTVVMGYRTFDSICKVTNFEKTGGQILPNRKKLVLTRESGHMEKILSMDSEPISEIDEVIKRSEQEEIWVIGGRQVYEALLPHISRLLITRIDGHFEGDVRFPHFSLKEWWIEGADPYMFHDPRDKYRSRHITWRKD